MKIFKRLFLIAWRNIFRNKRRSLLTLSILIMGSTGLILIGGFFDDMIEGFGEVFIHSQTGHIQVNAAGYQKKGVSSPFKYLMTDLARLQTLIESQPGVRYTVPRLKFQGMASSDETSIAVVALGVDPAREHLMGSFQTSRENLPSINIMEGKDLDPSDPYGALLGKGLMEALNLKVGDSMNFITTREAGALDGAVYHVRGVFQTFIKDFDERAMKVNLAGAQKLLAVPDQVHSLLVILDDTRKTKPVNTALEKRFSDKGLPLETFTWEEQGEYYRQSKALLRQIYVTIQLIITVIFFFSIANTINMALFERVREFGTMMALGNSRAVIFSMIFLEAALLGLVGSSLGLLAGSGLARIVSIFGIPMRPPQAASDYFCKIALSAPLLIETFFISFVSALLSSILPGWRASRFRIVQALGYV